jgi:SAM-dependent methyltransferase
MILNLGAGKKLIKGAVNCDVTPYPGIDQIVDLNKFPWPWEDGSIDGIHASHVIEHFPDQEVFIKECLRILKKGGFLRLVLPHSSNCVCIGCMGHYRTYSYNTCHSYLATPFYMFTEPKFKTVEQKLNWWYEAGDTWGFVPKPIFFIIKLVNPILTWLAMLQPSICENLWCYWVGGMREVVWKGVKL